MDTCRAGLSAGGGAGDIVNHSPIQKWEQRFFGKVVGGVCEWVCALERKVKCDRNSDGIAKIRKSKQKQMSFKIIFNIQYYIFTQWKYIINFILKWTVLKEYLLL